MDSDRETARALAHDHRTRNDPTGWFEALYSVAEGDESIIPWANMVPNPNVFDWMDRQNLSVSGGGALVVGCGLGHDAEALAQRGFEVVGFDISPTAIAWCKRLFPDSQVSYLVQNLLAAPAPWDHAFGLVLESYTLQTLPPELRLEAMARVARFVAPGGTLLVVCRGRDPGDGRGQMPWPLTRAELGAFREHGLAQSSFDDYMDDEDPPTRRFRVVYRRPEE